MSGPSEQNRHHSNMSEVDRTTTPQNGDSNLGQTTCKSTKPTSQTIESIGVEAQQQVLDCYQVHNGR